MHAAKVAPLLFGSGLCALIYQIAWLREFRLIFGASTASTAAVLAIFVGGLGAGGLVLGKRADRHPRPLAFYGHLEAAIAVSAAVTPLLLWLVRRIYLGAGGTLVLGLGLGTAVRGVLSAVVLGVPTFLMGGTLPAAARGTIVDEDAARRSTGMLYGVNTLGAVTGCLLANFWMIEQLGTRATLWTACAVNALVAVAARAYGAKATPPPSDGSADAGVGGAPPAPPAAVLAAAAVVGFAFFLMELVWYRMLGPILGGTVFTFGLILAAALLGIGLGGWLYGLLGKNRPATLTGFACTCLLEAAMIALPYALGDRLATFTLLLRPLGSLGFAGLIGSWSIVTLIVVFPGALVSGVQFPMLIGLLGRGRRGVGRQIGLGYAFNTAGAIAGSLAGGFGLMPQLTAPGCWRLVAWVLLLLGLAATGLALARERRYAATFGSIAVAAAVVIMVQARGPTAAWRHSPIGIGRVSTDSVASPQVRRAWVNEQRRRVAWEADGVESSVALRNQNGLAFVVNGSIDGNARGDAATQVMSGLVGAIVHPAPKSSLVIGLGTGSTAGWLGAIPTMANVDVIELEPVIATVAKACAPVNQNVLDNPKVRITNGDAREVLLTTTKRYDLVVSEPSNPFRAGIASLFTREYYEASRAILNEGGLFLQWAQAYNTDAQTMRTIYATLATVFPFVETWEMAGSDMLLVAAMAPPTYDMDKLRARVAEEPYRSAIESTWRAWSLEGFFAHYVARSSLAAAMRNAAAGPLNTDDRTPIEFGFARTASVRGLFSGADVRKAARARNEHRPERVVGAIDWNEVDDAWIEFVVSEENQDNPFDDGDDDQNTRARALAYCLSDQTALAVGTWSSQPREPRGLTELTAMAEAYANEGDDRAGQLITLLRAVQPTEADLVQARLMVRARRPADATSALERGFARLHTDVWTWPLVARHAFDTLEMTVNLDPTLAPRLYRAIAEPFAVHVQEDRRELSLLWLAQKHAVGVPCAETLRLVEPHVPWNEDFLSWRSRCYGTGPEPLAVRAREELAELTATKPVAFATGLAVH
jgi:spermidine synthase